jgi:membrane protein required for colicin V production
VIDFVLGVGLAALLIRGWLRGLVREAIGLGVVVAGTFLAFRFAGPMGAVVSGMSGAGEDASRIAGGIIVFLLVSVGGAVISWVMHKGVRLLPGLTTANRLGGAGFSGLAGLLAATVVVSVLTLLPLPDGPARALEDSALVGAMTDGDGIPQRILGLVSFDRVLAASLELQQLAGDYRVVAPPTGRVDIAAATGEELRIKGKAADKMAELINVSRIESDADPVARSEALDQVALDHALALYQRGRLTHNSRDGRVAERLAAADIPVVSSGEAIALAPSARSAHEAFLGDEAARTDISDTSYRRVGVGAVRGPLGLLVVIVLAG